MILDLSWRVPGWRSWAAGPRSWLLGDKNSWNICRTTTTDSGREFLARKSGIILEIHWNIWRDTGKFCIFETFSSPQHAKWCNLRTVHPHLCLILQDPGLPSRWGQWFETAGQAEHSDWLRPDFTSECAQIGSQILPDLCNRNPNASLTSLPPVGPVSLELRRRASLRATANASCSNGARHSFGSFEQSAGIGWNLDGIWIVWIVWIVWIDSRHCGHHHHHHHHHHQHRVHQHNNSHHHQHHQTLIDDLQWM